MTQGNLLIIADAACDTGFATVTHNLIDNLPNWNISVLAVNYRGDPHRLQKKVNLYVPTARNPMDVYGFGRVTSIINAEKTDVVLVINDPWVGEQYLDVLPDNVFKVLYTPVDAENIRREWSEKLSKYDRVITYTAFGKRELMKRGLTHVDAVIPHGVDLELFHPISKEVARKRGGMPEDWFVVNVTDRNANRKRLDLALYYFAEWVTRTNKPDNVMFYYHGALVDEGWDLLQIAADLDERGYNNIAARFITTHKELSAAKGIPVEYMKYVYAAADVGLSTTQGEGWGLTTMERMACGLPMIVPDYSALGEWTEGTVLYTLPNTEVPQYGVKGLNTIGYVPTLESTMYALEQLYLYPELRKELSRNALKLVRESRFQWYNIAKQFERIFMEYNNGSGNGRTEA